MTAELVPMDPATAPAAVGALPLLAQYLDFANRIANTDFVPRVMRGKPETILACLAKGYEVGLSPMQSLDLIDVIDGRPAIKPEGMRGLVAQAGHTFRITENTAERVTVKVRRREWPEGEWEAFSWSMADARAAGLAGKDVWKKYPRAMLLARATSEACRAVFPDVVKGLSYTPEELEGLGGAPLPPEVTPPKHVLISARITEWKAAGRDEWVAEAKAWWDTHADGMPWGRMPDDLADDYLAELDRIEGITDPDLPPDGDGGHPFGEVIDVDAETGEVIEDEPVPPTNAPAARKRRTRSKGELFHRRAGALGLDQSDHRVIVLGVSMGRTEHATELTDDEMSAAQMALTDIEHDPIRLDVMRRAVAKFESEHRDNHEGGAA